jgi:hypothetical protein
MAKRTLKDLQATAHDPINGVDLMAVKPQAKIAAAKARKELVHDIVLLLQNTMNERVSGIHFGAKIDLAGNYLHDLRTYAQSLAGAATTIKTEHPTADDSALEALIELSQLLVEGAARSETYLTAVRQFSQDLDGIKNELTTQLYNLHGEL